ncbi:PhoH family protein [Desulfoscipio gibsoniae]|uniref:PhoH family protein n=1 Tax=Desulfoscipio gibsoniae DSM 7213 TaxID=767817 RepID=R4KPR8_9FIRM|nr:PhoH family protein [Desulfoscipio gibsoniae]AGL03517.1 PhoH family protein [Desulfoscipio gibsoniae DSM 7213]
MRTVILDTNVLLDRPIEEILLSMEPCKIVIPLAVVNELDGFKHLDNSRGYCAREAIRFLDSLRPNLHKGFLLESGHIINVEVNHVGVSLPDFLSKDKVDTRIIGVAKGLSEETDGVSLVTQDICVRILADALGIAAENYAAEKVNLKTLYPGWLTINISSEQVQQLYEFNKIEYNDDSILPNQYLVMQDETGGSNLGRYDRQMGCILPLARDLNIFGISPIKNNFQQQFAVDALLNPDIHLVTLLGPAGTGKTLLALAAGLHQVVNLRRYSNLVITRALIPHGGQDIGFLPGTKEEKLNPWMGAIYDNLHFLIRNFTATKYGTDVTPGEKLKSFMQEGYLELEALTYIRGRSIPQQWIIIDEAQNLTKENIKTIVTRAGTGTKLVILGDIQQIDNYRLTAQNNGFVTLIDRFMGNELYAHITLQKTERSQLASLAVELLV